MGWRGAFLVLFLFWASAGAGETGRVKGQGFAMPQQPAVTNDPPASYMEEPHDPEKGEYFGGTLVYDLQQGAQPDHKGRWQKTDYIEWQVNGATLKAKGQVHDKDSKDATIASSEMWGAEVVKAKVEAAEGAYGSIEAFNTVSFSYAYVISGNHIGEASVQLQGHAFDIKGKRHDLNLSDQRAEGSTSEENKKQGLEKKDYGKLKAHYSNTPLGGAAGAGLESGSEEKTHQELEVKVSRRYASAGGDNDSTPAVRVHDVLTGLTPLERTYSVYSDARVILRARAGMVPDTEEESAVLVKLDVFKVTNSLRVYTAACDDPYPDPDPGPPYPEPLPGPTTPGEIPPPPPTPTPGSGGGSGGSSGAVDVDPEEEEEEESKGYVCGFQSPYGLLHQRGSLPGMIEVVLDEPAGRDTAFDIDVDLPGRVDLAGRDSLVVEQGERYGWIPFHGAAPGDVRITLTLLDAAGGPSSPVETLECSIESVNAFASPRIWARTPSLDGEEAVVRGFAGGEAMLRVGRLGFAGLETEATVLSVEVEDAEGVLEAAPAAVSIPPGETSVELPLALADAAGTARLFLVAGNQRVGVTVVSRKQEWSSAPVVYVPVGAVAPLPVSLRWPETSGRVVEAEVAGAAVGVVAEQSGQTSLLAGETAWFFRFRGVAVGRTTVMLSSPGLPDLELPVEVVAATVSIEAGTLRLTDLPAAAKGTLELWVPERMNIESITLPEDAGEYLTVSGLGTPRVVLTFEPSPDMPTQLSLPMRLGGDLSRLFEVGVFDTIREGGEDGARNSYHLEPR